VPIPVEFFETVIGIEVAIAGALLFQIRFFESTRVAEQDSARIPAPWARLAMAIVLGTTLFGSLYAIAAAQGERGAAVVVTVGLALSLLPILVRVLPPLSHARGDAAVTATGLVLYFIAVGVVVWLLNG
jgi:hypothetical protein